MVTLSAAFLAGALGIGTAQVGADGPRPAVCEAFAASVERPGAEHAPYPPIGDPWPIEVSRGKLVKDSRVTRRLSQYFPPLSLDEVRDRLMHFVVVPRHEWEHGYSHVTLSDEGGWLVVDKKCFKWIVRPGGLAFVIYPDGTAVYLASCRSDLGEPPK
jgi:hypothetical protein